MTFQKNCDTVLTESRTATQQRRKGEHHEGSTQRKPDRNCQDQPPERGLCQAQYRTQGNVFLAQPYVRSLFPPDRQGKGIPQGC